MQAYGQTLNLYLIQNLGDGTYGNVLEVTGHLLDLGDLGWEVDTNLNASQPQDVDVTLVEDGTGTLKNWLRNCIECPDGSNYPAFFLITLGGSPHYLGVINEENITWSGGDMTCQLSSQDWSSTLANVSLESVGRQIVGGTARSQSTAYTGYSYGKANVHLVYWRETQGNTSSDGTSEVRVWFPMTTNNWLVVGDRVQVAGGSTAGAEGTYTVTSAQIVTRNDAWLTSTSIGTPHLEVLLAGYLWPDPCPPHSALVPYRGWGTDPDTATFTRLASSVSPMVYFSVAAPPAWSTTSTYAANATVTYNGSRWFATQANTGQTPTAGSTTYWTATTNAVAVGSASAPVYRIYLDSTTPILVGDELDLKTQSDRSALTTFKVADVDSASSCIYTEDSIGQTLNVGDKLYFSEASNKQVVMTPARELIGQSNTVGSCDFSRFAAPTVSSPVLSPLPFRVSTGVAADVLYSPQDMQPGLTGLQIQGAGTTLGYTGTPEAGWTAGTWTPYVCWTNQLATAPVRLMPDLSKTLAPNVGWRNISLTTNWISRIHNDGSDTYVPLVTDTLAQQVICHDYVGFRRWLFTRVSSTITVANATWNGTTWTTGTVQTCAVIPQEAVPWPSIASSLGTGSAVLILDSTYYLRILYGATAPTPLLLPSAIGSVARLVQTIAGIYVVTPTGYGRVTVTNGVIALAYVDIPVDNGTLNLLPNTLTALDSTHLFCMASMVYVDPSSSEVTNTVALLQLDPTAASATNCLIYRTGQTAPDTVLKWVPRISMAFRSAEGNRIYGLVGSRAIQLGYIMSETIERSSVVDSTAKDVIDQACVAFNALSYTDAMGVLHVVSRNFADVQESTATNVAVDVVSTDVILTWENTVSQVEVSSTDDSSVYGYDSGGVNGKKALSIDSPFIATPSQCSAVAVAWCDFFGVKRAAREDTWAWSGGGMPPWVGLKPLQRVTINGSTKQWMLIKCVYRLGGLEADAVLIEVV